MTIKAGDILFLKYLDYEYRTNKYAVCVCISPDMVFFINSQNRAIYDCIEIKAESGRKIPRYDSYIGCKNLINISEYQIHEVCGRLSREERVRLLEKVKSSKTLPQKTVQMILDSFADLDN